MSSWDGRSSTLGQKHRPREIEDRCEVTEKIVAVAIYDGYIHTLPPPARHSHILWAMDTDPGPKNQGFLTSTGRYVSREEAHNIAFLSGQCKKPKNPTQLFSEDLW